MVNYLTSKRVKYNIAFKNDTKALNKRCASVQLKWAHIIEA